MTWIGWSLILASTVLIALRRRTFLEIFAAFWSPPPALGPTSPAHAPSPLTDVDPSVDGALDQASTSALPSHDENAPVRRAKPAPETLTDRDPTPISSSQAPVEIAVNAPSEPAAPIVAIAEPSPSPQTTPKALTPLIQATEDLTIPSFSLSVPSSATPVEPPASAAAIARAGAAAAVMAPPALSDASSSSMMPPPPPRIPKLNNLNNSSSSSSSSSLLSTPPTRPSPLPNRSQPQYDRQPGSSTLAPPPTHSSIPAKPSRKVILEPGHSPLDWARLANHPTADLRGLGPGTPYLRVTPSMLKKQTGRKGKDAWTALSGRVYNITPYLPFHPGGEPELLRAAGRDGTKLFGEIHPWVNYETMLSSCLVGLLVGEEEGQSGDMDAMD